MEELMFIQSKIHAPKDSVNQYGKYKYRKAEQILEAAKPLLEEKECTLVVSDEVVQVGNYIYIKSTSTITNKEGDSISAVGWAREADTLAGMSPGQVTGATSSYARKYSLCGLFAIDDTKDLDDESVTNPNVVNNSQNNVKRNAAQGVESDKNISVGEAIKMINGSNTTEELVRIFNTYRHLQQNDEFVKSLTEHKNKILKDNEKSNS